MRINDDNFKNQKKKLKKHYDEQRHLENILHHIEYCKTYEELQNHFVSKMYGFEELKNDLSGFFSFNLSKHGGVIRLICSILKDSNTVNLEFISLNHYKDFKNRR